MTMEPRRLDASEWDTWYRALEWAFGGLAESPEERGLWRELTEYDRTLAQWDGDRVVGSIGAFSLGLSVPGGAVVPTAGVTMVGVAATHRRQGILRELMRRALEDYREGDEPLAALTASEAGIYGRFGFGVATRSVAVDIDTARVTLNVPPGTDAVRLRVEEPGAELDRCEALYAGLVGGRPGMLERRPGWEKVALLDPPQDREGTSEMRLVLAERDGELVGYARYALKPDWAGGLPDGTVLVRDLDAVEPAAYAALLRFFLGTDLMGTVALRNRPEDDALLHMVSDIRRCRPRLMDRLYLRPVDVGAALAARTYLTDVDVVLAVTDDFCPWNEGRWRLSGGAKGAVCERTNDPVDLAVHVRALGTAYLGGPSLSGLAAAGLAQELRPGALTATATAFLSPVAPWLPHGF
ncbi:GNAT family N-acetyltransferase [Streptomyces sp. NBC_01803]|uniref:GNAT family N-acetyltransferase n=1 Tax=Streptomyces sp. NBC_01803 TaxID=2975946 RepID=UPI002DDB2F92|nr:GNAT family N-acetyltransferase [Streptomyces sp. NBC_01803]WSA46211.1 GNAT family N-acetyltransferase [Streptomyces sp. NBC_01803]